VESPSPIDEYEVQLSFAGFSWTVASDTSASTSWTRTVDVGDYARFGVGLYQLHAVSSGSAPCEGTILVRVGGSPFASVAGWAGLALAGLGVGAVAASARRSRRFVPGAMALGALGGLGTVVLLQQFAVAYPTRTLTLLGIGAGLLLPLAAAQLGGAAQPPPIDDLPAGPTSTPAEVVDDLPSGPTAPWTPDLVIPAGGAPSWSGPEPWSPPSQRLDPGVEVRVLERVDGRVHVECSNGWTTWLDASGLEPV
jgi:hypothetical protein